MDSNLEINDLLTIGELSRLTGIPSHTLRMWEKRYNSPKALRLPSGHRRYPYSEVQRLKLVTKAIEAGFRPNRIVRGTLEELKTLLSKTLSNSSEVPPSFSKSPDKPPFYSNNLLINSFSAIRNYDEDTLIQILNKEWDQSGALNFIENFISPFLEKFDKNGDFFTISVAQKQFAHERLSDFLSEKWRTMNSNKSGPIAILTSLPGDPSRLGPMMHAVVTALTELKIIYLGNNTPIPEIINVFRKTNAILLNVFISDSVSEADAFFLIHQIKSQLSPNTIIVAGGKGAPRDIPNVKIFSNFIKYYEWLIDTFN